MIDILRMINKEKNLIDQQLLIEDDVLTYYKDFFNKYKFITLDDILNVDACELAVALICSKSTERKLEEVKKVVYGNRYIFEQSDHDEISELAKLADNFANHPDLYEASKKIIYEKSERNITNIGKHETSIARMIIDLAKTFESEPEDFIAFFDFLIEETSSLCTTLGTLPALRTIKEEREDYYEILKELGEKKGRQVKSKIQDKWVSGMIKNDWNTSALLKGINEVNQYYCNLLRQQTSRNRALAKNKKAYEQLEEDLYQAIQLQEITSVQSLLKKVPSEEIRIAVLKLIYNHNQEFYKKLTEEYKTLAANDASHYQVLLAKYGISPNTYDVGTIMSNNIEDLEKMLATLSKLKLVTSQELLRIVQTSNLETISNIQSLTEKGIITTKLPKEQPALFNPTSKEYEDFMRNLNLINQMKLNPQSLSATEKVFLTPHQRFLTNMKVLENYELTSQIKVGKNLSFLKDQNLSEGIDKLLELGYEKNLEEYLELLNYKDKFDRLYILKELNIPVETTQQLIEVLSTDKFYVGDEDINNYLYNATLYQIPKDIEQLEEPKKKVAELIKLSEFDNTSRTYKFDGILISKNKVLRNLSTITTTGKQQDRLLYGIIKGSILSDEEVTKIKNSLTSQKTSSSAKVKS